MKKLIIIIGFLIITFLIFLMVLIFPRISSREEISIKNETTSGVINSEPTAKIESSELSEIIDNNFSSSSDFAVVIKNFDTKEEVTYNSNKFFDSASLYKLWVLGVAMQELEEGDLDESDSISGNKNKYDERLAINPIENAEDQDEGDEKEEQLISMKVDIAIEKMITESDNYAALLLSDKLGVKAIEKFFEIYNLSNSSYGIPPRTTAGDIANYFELLYNGNIVNDDSSLEMIDILSRQELNDRIPKYLPDEIVVAHKTGELLGSKHDAGIVYGNNGDYLIVVLSKTKNESIAAERIAKFSEEIYNYFEKKN